MEKSEDFSLKSPYKPDFLEIRLSMFSQDKYKDFSFLSQSGKSLAKFHSLLLEDEDLKHLSNENCSFILPIEIPEEFLEEILNFFYFRKIERIPLKNIFFFMKIARFLQLKKLEESLIEFINEKTREKKPEIALFFIKEIYLYRDFSGVFAGIFIDLLNFIRKTCFEGFLKIFDDKFLEVFGLNFLEIFSETLREMKILGFSNDQLFSFLMVFREKILQKTPNFSFEIFLSENLNFSTISLVELQEFTKELGISELLDLKFKLLNEHLLKNQAEICSISEENLDLKDKFDKILKENEDLSLKNQELTDSMKVFINEKALFQQKIDEINAKNLQDLSEIKIKIKEIDLINNPFQKPEASDALNFLLFQHFNQNYPKKILFDSSMDNLQAFCSRIPSQKNVVFHFEIKENINFGVFFSIEMPKPFSEDRFFVDKSSFMFDIDKKEVYKAAKGQEKQLRTFKGYVYCFGDSKQGDGWEFKDLSMVVIGRKTEQYEGENLYGFDNREAKLVKRIRVYKLII